jgi:hypothetical protein
MTRAAEDKNTVVQEVELATQLRKLSEELAAGHDETCSLYHPHDGICDCGYERAAMLIIEPASDGADELEKLAGLLRQILSIEAVAKVLPYAVWEAGLVALARLHPRAGALRE